MALNLVDKAFLQGIMSYKAMPAAEALKYYNSCETKVATHESRPTKKLRDQHALSQKIDHITR